MSGPKVIRVVTREEIEAICRRHLALADAAAEELRRSAKRHDVLTEELTAHLDKRLRTLKSLFQGERWGELQAQAPLTIQFFKHESEQIRIRAIEAAEKARSKRRRLADAARTLAVAIEANGGESSPALRNVILKAGSAADNDLELMQGVLNENYALLGAHRKASGVSEEQRRLARRLGSEETTQTFAEWLAAHNARGEHCDARLDKLIAEMETLEDLETLGPFKQRVVAIMLENDDQRRALLTDSLVLDLSDRSKRRRLHELQVIRLHQILAELRTLNTQDSIAMQARITEALNSPNLENADDLAVKAEAVRDDQMNKLCAVARRRAVLQGLAELGYEVRETMATAWARDGRLVVRKPDVSDYGVELGAPSDVSRLQVRLVGSDRPVSIRDGQRDRDMETSWCSEFSRLRQLLAKHGGEIVIERALDVGVEPVKTVPLMDSDREKGRRARQVTR
jgi:hypothetical protein